MGYLSNPAQFARCQSAYDNMSPPDEYCPDCGREASCDCICDGFATAGELADAALELEIERGITDMTLQEIHAELQTIVPEAKTVKVQHSYINNICQEAWEAMFYDLTGSMIFMVHGAKSIKDMVEDSRKQYAGLNMDSVKKARKAELKRQLEELEEMDIAA